MMSQEHVNILTQSCCLIQEAKVTVYCSSKISQVLKLFTSISNALEISSLFLKYITKTGLTTEAEGHRKPIHHGVLHCLAGVKG